MTRGVNHGLDVWRRFEKFFVNLKYFSVDAGRPSKAGRSLDQ